jgi:hypothetical protein
MADLALHTGPDKVDGLGSPEQGADREEVLHMQAALEVLRKQVVLVVETVATD